MDIEYTYRYCSYRSYLAICFGIMHLGLFIHNAPLMWFRDRFVCTHHYKSPTLLVRHLPPWVPKRKFRISPLKRIVIAYTKERTYCIDTENIQFISDALTLCLWLSNMDRCIVLSFSRPTRLRVEQIFIISIEKPKDFHEHRIPTNISF